MTHAVPTSHERFTVITHPLIEHKLAQLRDARTPPGAFRRLVSDISTLMLFEATRDLPTRAIEIETPMERTEAREIAAPVTLVPVLRAGLGMVEGMLGLLPEARVGHIGLSRDELTLKPVTYLERLPPDVAAGPVLLLDPMLATGGSAVRAIDLLRSAGVRDIHMICLVAAPEGVARMAQDCPEVPVFAAALDRQLNAVGFICPGLGDAGDRQFGTA